MLNWYMQTGKDSDVVISSKITLARNLSHFNFYIKEDEEIQKLENLIKEKSLNLGYGLKFIKLTEIDELTLQELIEKGLITDKVIQNKKRKFILLNDEENICIVINDEDHLQMQVFASGFELEAITNLCIEIDEKIQTLFNISQNSKYGYLTSCPTNVGTGAKLSTTLHLIGLNKTNNIQNVIRFARQFGMEITQERNLDIYRITNEKTLGITEEEILKILKTITEKIVEQERTARKILADNKIELEDMIFRSYGILNNCRKISMSEAEELLSNIKLGTDLGIITDLTDCKVKKLYLYIKPASLSKYLGQEINFDEQSIKRAEVIKKITKE